MIFTGHACRLERKRVGLPMKTLAVLSGLSPSALCCYELGQGLLRAEVRERIEDALARVERVRQAFLPGKLDLSDASALKEAMAAYERGDKTWFAERAKPPENPVAVTF